MKCVAYIVQDEGSTPLSELPGRAPIGAAAVPFLAVQRPDGTRTIFHPLWAPGDGNELERFELGYSPHDEEELEGLFKMREQSYTFTGLLFYVLHWLVP